VNAKKEADDKAKTELQKAQDAVTAAKAEAEATEQRMYNVLLRTAFDRVAGGQIADDLLDVAFVAARESGLLNGDSGIVVDIEAATVKGVDKAVEKLLKNKPSLKKVSQAAPPGTGGSEGGGTSPPGQLTEAQQAAYKRRFGIK
jgi:hypothetical protein